MCAKPTSLRPKLHRATHILYIYLLLLYSIIKINIIEGLKITNMNIAFIGYAGCGKNTAYDTIKETYPNEVINISFAEPLKEIASILTGFRKELFDDQEFKNKKLPPEWIINSSYPEEVYTVRKFMQTLGTEALRDSLCYDTWLNCAKRKREENKDKIAIFTDCRFINEYNYLRSINTKFIRITRNVLNNPKEIYSHSSELSINGFNVDWVIDNNEDISSFQEKVLNLFEFISQVDSSIFHKNHIF